MNSLSFFLLSSSFLLIGWMSTVSSSPLVDNVSPSSSLPPMGWMSWQVFRCQVDCTTYPNDCINEELYKVHADILASEGYLEAGYKTISVDDCWSSLDGRDSKTQRLVANSTRFPSGMKDLGDYIHSKGVNYGLYTAESDRTCAGYLGSKGYEEIDAHTFLEWGVDYLKVDGCGDPDYYEEGYELMGHFLKKSSSSSSKQAPTYSCSWPAYLGDDETQKPYKTFLKDKCDLWRNWNDIDCSWDSLSSIIEHYGNYSSFLASISGIDGEIIIVNDDGENRDNHFKAHGQLGYNDPDMLLVGNSCITDEEAKTQLSIWSIMAAPLIMGNDLRLVTPSQKKLLLNKEVLSIDQDKLQKSGYRLFKSLPPSSSMPKKKSSSNNLEQDTSPELWYRELQGKSFVLGVFNNQGKSINKAEIDLKLIPNIDSSVDYSVRDLWEQKDITRVKGNDTIILKNILPHDTSLCKFTPFL